MDFNILAVYQRELAGSGSCHQTAILFPTLRALATLIGALLVLPCSILRRRFHFLCPMLQAYAGGKACEGSVRRCRYQRESAGPVPCHHTAILCPDRRSAATLGVVVVLPCSILRSRLHFAWEMRRVYGVFWGGRASERNTTAWGVVWTQGHTVTLTFAHRVLSTGAGATGP